MTIRKKFFSLPRIQDVCYYGLILLLIVFSVLMLGQLAYAQEGTYNLVIQGKVTHTDGKPSAFTVVELKTADGETFETQTNVTGSFLLEASVTAEQGVLAVKSNFDKEMVFGRLPFSWSAGGFGEKKLAADLVMDATGEMTVRGGGTELPLPDTPGDSGMPGELPALPTVTPALATADITSTAAIVPVAPAPAPAPAEPTGTGAIILLIVIGVLGAVLLIGGIIFAIKTVN